MNCLSPRSGDILLAPALAGNLVVTQFESPGWGLWPLLVFIAFIQINPPGSRACPSNPEEDVSASNFPPGQGGVAAP